MSLESLAVLYRRMIVATLTRRDDGELILQYQREIVDNSAGRILLSASIPVREAPYRTSELLPFFDGLLPEGQARTQLARHLRLEERDVFGFLREIGRDCAGALSIVPQASSLEADAGVEWLDEITLARQVAELGVRPLGVEPEKDIRISLAGVQVKMAVVIDDDGQVGLPRGTTPSTHILKPGSLERRGRRGEKPAYPALVANEAFCMRLAADIGLQTPQIRLMRIEGEPALLVARYDRVSTGGHVERIHQEDFCQALGMAPYRKYEADGGPALLDLVGLLRRISVRVIDDIDALIDRVAFNYLIGNADAHAKNFSLLYGEPGPTLAPAYDLLSTATYDQLDKRMAMSIGGTHDAGNLHPVHWQREFGRLRVSTRRYTVRVRNIANAVLAALPEARLWIRQEGADDRRLDTIERLVVRRAALLRRSS